ncbi:hypothetical protein QBC40DRAFT_251122 [Triangularia verruculosa]|uniref:Uncharacterized protein n=1 Tax=Triangularia verruculosa TaxID=2587418 RepID=A0AAN6XN66_9PEZI|nr:hypothetical protein QBC40DRAFT_251122 [Triangularia verruculosa]
MSSIHSELAALIWSQMLPWILYPTAAVFVGLYLYSLGLAIIIVVEYLTLLALPGVFIPDNNQEDDNEDEEQDDNIDSQPEKSKEDGEDDGRKTGFRPNHRAPTRYPRFLTINTAVDEDEQTSDSNPADTPSPSTGHFNPNHQQDNREQPFGEEKAELLGDSTKKQGASPAKPSNPCKHLDDALEQWRQDKIELYHTKMQNEHLMDAIMKHEIRESVVADQLSVSDRKLGSYEEVEDDHIYSELGYSPRPGERTWSL